MTYSITLPDGEQVDFEDNVKPEDADRFLREQYKPQAFKKFGAGQATEGPSFDPRQEAAQAGFSAGEGNPAWQLPQRVTTQTPESNTAKAAAQAAKNSVQQITSGETFRNWYYGHRLAQLERERLAEDTPTFEADGQVFTDPTTAAQKEERRLQATKQYDEFLAKYKDSQSKFDAANELVRQARPEDAGIVDDAIISFAGSAPTMALGVGLGLVSPVTGMAVAGSIGGFQEAQSTQSEAFKKTKTFTAGDDAALINGIIEGLGDAVGLHGVFKQSKNALVALARALNYEGGQEAVTQLLQDVVSKSTYDPNLGWDEMGRNAAVAYLAGVMGGGVMAPVAAAGAKVNEMRFNSQMEKLANAESDINMSLMSRPDAVARAGLNPNIGGNGLADPANPPEYNSPTYPTSINAPAVAAPISEPAIGSTQPTATTTETFSGPTSYGPTAMMTPQEESFQLDLASAISSDTQEAVAMVLANRDLLMNHKQSPIAITQQLVDQGHITLEQGKQFQTELLNKLNQLMTGHDEEIAGLKDVTERLSAQLEQFADTPMPMLPGEKREYNFAMDPRLEQLLNWLEQQSPDKPLETADYAAMQELSQELWSVAKKARVNTKTIGGMLMQATDRFMSNPATLGRARSTLRQLLRYGLNLDTKSRAETFEILPGWHPTNYMGQGTLLPFQFQHKKVDWSLKPVKDSEYPNAAKIFELPAEGNAVTYASSEESARDKAIIKNAAKVVRRWLDDMHMKNMNVAVYVDPDASRLGSAMWLGDTFVIFMNPRAFENIDEGDGVKMFYSTLAHELGHSLGTKFLEMSPESTQRAVMRLYQNDVRKILSGEADLQIMTGPKTSFRRDIVIDAANEYLGYDPAKKDANPYSEAMGLGYHLSFTEWLARKFEQLYSSNFNRMQSVVAEELKSAEPLAFNWLQKSFNLLKQLYESAKQHLFVDQTFQDFMRASISLAAAKNLEHQQAIEAQNVLNLVNPTEPAIPMPVRTKMVPLPVETQMDRGFMAYAKIPGMPPRIGGQFRQDLDSFNWARRWLQGLLDIAKANPHIRELNDPMGVRDPATGSVKYGYLNYVTMWAREKSAWVSRADLRLKQWRALDKNQAVWIGELMLEQTDSGRYLTPQEIAANWPQLSREALELYEDIKNDFEDLNREMEQALLAETLRMFSNNPFVQQRLAEVRKTFATMRAKPYFPMSRFGKHLLLVYDNSNKVVHFESHDLGIQAALRVKKLEQQYPGHNVKRTLARETDMAFGGIRRELLEALGSRLQLTAQQQSELRNYLYELAPAQSFRKHLMQRKKTRGFSFDTQRAYADYFMKASGHLARVKYGDPMRAAKERLHLTAMDHTAPDTVTRQKIANYVTRHLDYLLNPVNEWAAFRAGVSVLYLGASISTAVQNVFQVPVFTYSHLAAKFGDAMATKQILAAYKDVPKIIRIFRKLSRNEQAIMDKWGNGIPLTSAEQQVVRSITGIGVEARHAMLRARQDNVLNQSFAMELAAMAEGSILNKMQATYEATYWSRWAVHASMVPFELTEYLNRNVTFLAAFRLAQQSGQNPDQAYQTAVDAVNSTQFDYSKINRPELLRGKKSLMFMFMQYQLNAMSFLLGGDKGWWRALAVLLMFAGLKGLPFADDIEDLITWLWSGDNKRFNAKLEVKKAAETLGEMLGTSPDLFLHGPAGSLLNQATGADISGPLSLGDMVPGTEVIASAGQWDEKVLQSAREGGGAFATLALNMMRGAMDSSLPPERRAELLMPARVVRNLMVANRWAQTGAETDVKGARMYEVDSREVVLRALGFQPRELQQIREEKLIRQDFVQFYQLRQKVLLAKWDQARESQDSEKVDAVKAEIADYNNSVPTNLLRISPTQLQRSYRQREKGRNREEAGRDAGRLQRGARQAMEQQ